MLMLTLQKGLHTFYVKIMLILIQIVLKFTQNYVKIEVTLT